jgi:pyrimidine operon attenuation protein/uracil phosphoribosyltransferase
VGQPKIIGAGEIQAAIEQLARAIVERHAATARLLVLGIANGGIELARRVARQMQSIEPRLSVKAGVVDISFHRDDITRNPIPKEFAPTHIPGDVNGATIILVDDVLHSGRTIKAALDELFDHGRPTKVELAILVDRGGRRLPFTPDYCGLHLSPTENEKVAVHLDATQPNRDQIRLEPTTVRNPAL